jgi:hypothetical protein
MIRKEKRTSTVRIPCNKVGLKLGSLGANLDKRSIETRLMEKLEFITIKIAR